MQQHNKHLWLISSNTVADSHDEEKSVLSVILLFFIIIISPFEHPLYIQYKVTFRRKINFTQNSYVPLQKHLYLFDFSIQILVYKVSAQKSIQFRLKLHIF